MRSLVQNGTNRVEPRCWSAGNASPSQANGAIEVVQLQRGGTVEQVVVLPLVGGPVTARSQQALQYGEKDGPLEGKLEATRGQELLQHRGTIGLLPEAFK